MQHRGGSRRRAVRETRRPARDWWPLDRVVASSFGPAVCCRHPAVAQVCYRRADEGHHVDLAREASGSTAPHAAGGQRIWAAAHWTRALHRADDTAIRASNAVPTNSRSMAAPLDPVQGDRSRPTSGPNAGSARALASAPAARPPARSPFSTSRNRSAVGAPTRDEHLLLGPEVDDGPAPVDPVRAIARMLAAGVPLRVRTAPSPRTRSVERRSGAFARLPGPRTARRRGAYRRYH